jgi:hypothetical protein
MFFLPLRAYIKAESHVNHKRMHIHFHFTFSFHCNFSFLPFSFTLSFSFTYHLRIQFFSHFFFRLSYCIKYEDFFIMHCLQKFYCFQGIMKAHSPFNFLFHYSTENETFCMREIFLHFFFCDD